MIYWLAAFFIGAGSVLQAGLNRQIARDAGLLGATLINTGLMFAALILVWVVTRYAPDYFSETFVPKWNPSELKWWIILPAICGFILVAGIPTLIPRIGAMGAFLGMVTAQMIFGMAWDIYVEHIPFEPKRLVGASLAIVGLIVANWKN